MPEDLFGVGKVVEKLMDPITDLVKKLAGPAAEEVGFALQDSVKVWRAKRQYRLFEKLNGIIREAGFEPKPIALKVLLPALDYASVEQDEDLHSAVANLLAGAADPNHESMFHGIYVDILRQMSKQEFLFLKAAYQSITRAVSEYEAIPESQRPPQNEPLSQLGTIAAQYEIFLAANGWESEREKRQFSFRLEIDNLVRLGLVAPTNALLHNRMSFTLLSTTFLDACSPPTRRSSWR